VEADLSRAVRDLVQATWGKDAVFRRIEDASGNLGTFDAWIVIRGHVAVTELKVAGPNAKPDMRRGQPAFGSDWTRAGGRAWVLVGHPDGSLRLLRGDTLGEDWRDCLVRRDDRLTPDLIRFMVGLPDE
jgi:hypothetical protein